MVVCNKKNVQSMPAAMLLMTAAAGILLEEEIL
jgi:hypothetical protein